MPELYKGVLIKRYKRFLADIKLSTGDTITAHTANTGRMLECSEPGREVWVSFHDNPRRKYKYSWDIIDMGTSLVGINTLLPNRLVKISIEAGLIDELNGYEIIKQEVKISPDSRLDLGLFKKGRRDCYIEVKNCTYVKNGIAAFPDAVTKRGLKHLKELQKLVMQKKRCLMFYIIQRMDALSFEPADGIDPEYGDELRHAVKNGIEIFAFDTIITTDSIKLGRRIPVNLKKSA